MFEALHRCIDTRDSSSEVLIEGIGYSLLGQQGWHDIIWDDG